MTPLQFAREQCANFEYDGSCAGIGIKHDGLIFMFGIKPACLLASKQPCRYFEECVLPMGIELCNAVNVQREKERQEAIHLYAKFAPNYSKTSGRKCKECHQRTVAPRRSLCSVCAKEREIRRARLAMQKRRSGVTNPD